jgi:hypothetical protein
MGGYVLQQAMVRIWMVCWCVGSKGTAAALVS